MGLFKDYSFTVDVPVDKAQAVFEKITGEYGKFVRDSFDKHPFTGTIKKGQFSLIPNVEGMSCKLVGTFQSEGMSKTRVNVSGKILVGRLILLGLILIAVVPLIGLIGMLGMEEGSESAWALIFVPITIAVAVGFAILRFPTSQYNLYVIEIMRKLDNHDVVI